MNSMKEGKKNRMECRQCKIEGKGLIGGQAFTQYECQKCGQLAYHHNTNVPKFCSSCSETELICQRCGKDLLKEAILLQKETKSLYEIALDIGCSETSLYKYINFDQVGERVLKKIRKWYKNGN